MAPVTAESLVSNGLWFVLGLVFGALFAGWLVATGRATGGQTWSGSVAPPEAPGEEFYAALKRRTAELQRKAVGE